MYVFGVNKGKLFDHVIYKYEVKKDPPRVEIIQNIPLLETKKVFQSFFGKINFIQRFILNFTEIKKHVSNMLNKCCVVSESLPSSL
jgi:hypothetical protein